MNYIWGPYWPPPPPRVELPELNRISFDFPTSPSVVVVVLATVTGSFSTMALIARATHDQC